MNEKLSSRSATASRDAAPAAGAGTDAERADGADGVARARALIASEIVRFVSGQLDDELIVTARRWIAAGRIEDAVLSVAAAVLTSATPLHDRLVLSVASLLGSDEIAAALAENAVPEETEIPSRHDILPVEGTLPRIETVLGLADARGDVVTVWCAARRPPLGAPWPPARPVWVIESDPHADVGTLVGALQDALVATGVTVPIVEARRVGDRPTDTELAVIEIGEVLWTCLEEIEPTIAPVYDAGADGSGRFAPDHEIIGGDERERMLAYLDGGTVVSSVPSTHADVVDPGERDPVPIDLVTDGRWIWSEATRYYLDRYGLAPVEPFLAHLRSARGPTPPVDWRSLQRVKAELLEVLV